MASTFATAVLRRHRAWVNHEVWRRSWFLGLVGLALLSLGLCAQQFVVGHRARTFQAVRAGALAGASASFVGRSLFTPPPPAQQGSVLVFPYYTSTAGGASNTIINISNLGTQNVILHYFFLNGTNCSLLDAILVLAPNKCFSFSTFAIDPLTTGWAMFVAVDANGNPRQYNQLAGTAYLMDGNYVGSYAAEVFQAHTATPATLNGASATLNFDGTNYDQVAGSLTTNIQSPVDAVGQKVVTVGMRGEMTANTVNGAAQIGGGAVTNTRTGSLRSFADFLQGNCQAMATITTGAPRVAGLGGLAAFLPSGDMGRLQFGIGGGVGLLLTPQTAPQSGIRALQKTLLTNAALTIPVFVPPVLPPDGAPLGAIAAQPQDAVALAGSIVTFSAAAPGANALQWQVSRDSGTTFTDLPGQTQPTLTIAPVLPTMNDDRYRAIFVFACNIEISDAARLTVDTRLPVSSLTTRVGGVQPAGVDDPAICLEPGGLMGVEATLTNPNANTLAATFTATLPTGLRAIVGTCTTDVNPGGCTVAANGGSVTWNGTLAAKQTVTIIYRARLDTTITTGTQLCIDNTGSVGGAASNVPYCFKADCALANPRVSDQKAGSVLVFPYYTSTIGGASDTRMTISNLSEAATSVAKQAYVHLFFIEGATCQASDLFLCLTPGASLAFRASEYDPGNTGYVLAVAVTNQGLPVPNNVLVGNAFVTTPTLADNYGAESFWANSFSVATVNGDSATLYFDQIGYDAVPKQFAIEIQSPLDAVGQQVVTVSMNGNLTTGQMTGAAQAGTGQAFNEKETFVSFSNWLLGVCQALGTLSTNSPRVPNGLGNLIKSGQAGSLKINVGGAVGLLLTPRTATWKGIRTLHKTQITATTLTIPIFVPVC